MDEKIIKYHIEEIKLILFILSTDLSDYDEDTLILFTEAIEGRIDVLFSFDFISDLNENLKINKDITDKFEILRRKVIKIYSKQWHEKLKKNNEDIIEIRQLAKVILKLSDINYIEPLNYFE